MNSEEMSQITKWMSTLEVGTLDVLDQVAYFQAVGEMLEKVKPIAIKYIAKEENSTFLFKL